MKQKITRVREGNCYFYKHCQVTGIKDQFNTNLFHGIFNRKECQTFRKEPVRIRGKRMLK